MDDLHFKELAWILELQRHPDWALVMRFLSALGSGPLLAGLPVLIYLSVNRSWGARLAVCYFLGMWLNDVLKLALHSPRPFWLDERINAFHYTGKPMSYGLPSGHAQVDRKSVV